ncbi:hypothetical protein C7S13_2183 [Burkholderia cepacia]|nr:hypothetical protein [Burkholderia cepacia]
MNVGRSAAYAAPASHNAAAAATISGEFSFWILYADGAPKRAVRDATDQ